MLQSRGISDLLAAEKKAQELIEEARKRRSRTLVDRIVHTVRSSFPLGKNKRIKDAQNEAKAEIEQFKAERERRYKALEQQVRNSLDELFFSFDLVPSISN